MYGRCWQETMAMEEKLEECKMSLTYITRCAPKRRADTHAMPRQPVPGQADSFQKKHQPEAVET